MNVMKFIFYVIGMILFHEIFVIFFPVVVNMSAIKCSFL